MTSRTGKPSEPEPLLPRVARGDAGAVAEFTDRYGALVWSLARDAVRDRSGAEDAVQEIFISLWKAAGRFDAERGSESLFVTTVARRRLIDRHRKHSRGPEVESLGEIALADPDVGLERVDAEDEAGVAMEALRRVPLKQRRLLELWVVNGMTHTEIATSTGLPLGTVKSQIRRGLQRVREMLAIGPLAASREVTA